MLKRVINTIIILSVVFTLVSCGGMVSESMKDAISSKELTEFGFVYPASDGIIDKSEKTVAVTVPFGTDRAALVAEFTTTGVKTTINEVEQISGKTANDFTNPLIYTVTAKDGTIADYTVSVAVAPRRDSKDIISFVINGQSYSSITGTDIMVTVPYGLSKTTLIPAISHSGKSISPASGVVQDFTDPVSYIVTAADGSTEEYSVTVRTWVKTLGNSSSDEANSICTDPEGNVYVTGFFQGTLNFGRGNMTNKGYEDVFIVKYDKNGNCLWSRSIGGSGSDRGKFIYRDKAGNIYVTGFFESTVIFGIGAGSRTVTSNGRYDAFVVKYTANGVYQWVKTFGGTSMDFGSSICTDSSGNIYITGNFASTVDFGSGSVTTRGGYDVFVIKYAADADGTFQWVKTFGANDDDWGTSICMDSSDNLFFTGCFQGTVNFGGGNVTSQGFEDVFVVKYTANTSDTYQWVKILGGTNYDRGTSVCTDISGNLYVTGEFIDTVNFGNESVTSKGWSDTFVVKYANDQGGTYQWAKTFGAGNHDRSYSVCTGLYGDTYITGYFQGTVNFGGGNVTSQEWEDAYVVKYSANGNYQWVKTIGGTMYQFGNSVYADSFGHVYVAGYFYSSVDFGDGYISASGGAQSDIFILQVNQ